jgi:hypothetical protein
MDRYTVQIRSVDASQTPDAKPHPGVGHRPLTKMISMNLRGAEAVERGPLPGPNNFRRVNKFIKL